MYNNHMNTEKDITLRPVTMEAIEVSIRTSEERLAKRLTTDLSAKIDDSYDELARDTQKEFAKIEKRFDAMDERFNIVDLKLVGLQNQLDNVYTNYTVRREHEILSGRVSKIERKVAHIS